MTDPYSEMMYNPMDVPDGKFIWEHYPALQRRRELCKIPFQSFEDLEPDYTPGPRELDLLVRFMTLCCDRKSPFYDESDWDERRRLCIENVGIQKSTVLHKMIMQGHWWFNTVLTAYLNISANDLFSSWLSMKVATADIRLFMRQSVAEVSDPEKHMRAKIAAAGELEKMDQKVMALEIRLFPNSEMAIAAMEASTADEIGGYAEKHARDFFKEHKYELPVL